MGLSVDEQETSISYMRDSDQCRIYTSDTTVMTKLDKLVEDEESPLWKLVTEHKLKDGTLVAKTYETNKNLISFRKGISTRNLTDEQRQSRSERMKEYQKNRKKINDNI